VKLQAGQTGLIDPRKRSGRCQLRVFEVRPSRWCTTTSLPIPETCRSSHRPGGGHLPLVAYFSGGTGGYTLTVRTFSKG